MAEAGKIKSLLFFFLKIALAVLVVWILFSRGQQEILKCLRNFDYRFLFPAIFFQFFQGAVCGWRWQNLAKVLGVKLSFFEAFSLTMQGNFFSLVIPGGAIGGDVVKMAVISKRSLSGNKLEGVFTVFMDRVVGMVSLFSLTLLLLIPGAELLMKVQFAQLHREPWLNVLFIAGTALLCLAGLGASAMIFFHRSLFKLPGVKTLAEKGELLSHGGLSRMTGAADLYASHWKKLLFLVLITTFFVHLMVVIPFFFILTGMGIKYSFFAVILAATIGNIAGLIPLFPGGIGIRDLVTVTILSASSIAAGDAKAAMLLATALLLVMNLSGGLFFIFDPGRRKQEVENEQQ